MVQSNQEKGGKKVSQELKELLRSVLKEELQPIHERLGRLEEGQLRLEEKLDNFMIETRSHFKKMEDELEQHRHMFELVSNKWKNIEIDIDYLSAKTGKHDTEINKLKKKLEFVQL
jgi:chromosome segregation ATPase